MPTSALGTRQRETGEQPNDSTVPPGRGEHVDGFWGPSNELLGYFQLPRRGGERRETPSVAGRYYADPDSSEDPPGTSTILPITPPFASNSCARLASARGKRSATSGLIFCC